MAPPPDAEVIDVDDPDVMEISRPQRSSEQPVRKEPRKPEAIDLTLDDDSESDVEPKREESSVNDCKPVRLPQGSSSRTPTQAPSVRYGAYASSAKPLGALSNLHEQTRRMKTKKIKVEVKVEKVEEEDSDEDYDLMHGFNPFTWPPGERDVLEALVEPMESVVEPSAPWKRRYVDISAGFHFPTPIPKSPDTIYVWDALRMIKTLRHPLPPPPFHSRKRPRLVEGLDMDHYSMVHHFRRAGGSINQIIQHNGRIVVCSNTAGGNNTSETDPYNKTGTLISWCKRDPLKICDLEQGDPKNLDKKHYTVNAIAYDPASQTLAASCAENYVGTWEFDPMDDEEPYTPSGKYKYTTRSNYASPHELAFKPGDDTDPILAVAERRLTIQNLESGTQSTYDLVKDKNEQESHVTGSIVWGCESTSHIIFASSEPKGVNNGFHMAFDTDVEKLAYQFDADEAGDALAVNPTGGIVALATNDGTDSFLRLYDVKRQNSAAIQTRRLETFASTDREVNHMAFSSDSIYLAVGRDDNCAHVYDVRMLEKGVLLDFKHSEMLYRVPEQNLFGVVRVQWVETPNQRLGLVTGGNDGCVRLWNPLCARGEGIVVAQANSDVAYFTVGDPYNGDHGLVVGDSDGAVYVMDRTYV
ncbi:WD40-repeat-containing domain protein [Mycena sp. CBHHK59/15]|nr:WD40-repeat-containing domain protein [Mycena sp. CBHHK59/15]